MSGSSAAFTIGLVQMRCSTDPEDNLRRACDAVRAAAGSGARVICLPELFRTQYFCQTEDAHHFDLAEAIPGPTTVALAAVAKATGAVVVGSVFGGHLARTTMTTLNAVAAFNPGARSWRVVEVQNPPAKRVYHSAVWTGSYMLITGGLLDGGASTANGAVFYP